VLASDRTGAHHAARAAPATQELRDTSAHAFGLAPEDLGERVLATVLFNDIVGLTALVEKARRPRLGPS